MEITLSCKKLLLTNQNKWKMAIVNESEQKVVLNYIKTQKLLASLIDVLKIYLRFFPNSQTNGGRRSPDVTHYYSKSYFCFINLWNLCVPPKFNHHHKDRRLASPGIMCPYFMKHSDMHVRYISTDFYKTENSGEKDYSTEL